jgi:endonuclease/exonuclease/phosphatase family metal-dependent hydrolase
MALNGRLGRVAALRCGVFLGALALVAPAAVAQTTKTIVVSKDGTIRGGSYADTKHGRESILVTRKSDDLTYERRAAVMFDTHTTVPEKAQIQSATLVLTVRGGNSEVRSLAAYSVPVSFENDDITWRRRNASTGWAHAGGDITGTPAQGTASPVAGSLVTFDVTQQVQRVVNGDFGSRYARFLVVDAGTNSRDSYREYHSLESGTTSARPRLIVTYGGSDSSSGSGGGSVVSPDGSGNLTLTPDHVTARAGKWVIENNSGALSGKVIRHPDAGAAKVNTAASSPANYFEMQFHAEAGKPYRIWLRGRADNNHWANDSVHLQFSGSVTKSGSATWRIGTTSSTEINLEECNGCGLSGWVWEDNGWGARNALGPEIYFASTGTQTIRVQTREDGLAVDRILLSPSTFLTTRPTDSGGTTSPSSSTTAAVKPDGSGNLTLTPDNVTARAGKWVLENNSGALSGKVVRHPDAGLAKINTALASPAHYFEMQFEAVAGQPYRIWLRGRADRDDWNNDSVHVQFSGSVTKSGSATWRIGSTSSTVINLEECNGCGLSGWMWEDNGWGGRDVLGPEIYFATSGVQTIRVQTREDGLAVDRIVLSPSTFLSASPGGTSTSPSTSEPPPTSTAGVKLRVLMWNLHHGVGTDGKYNLDRIATWMAKMTPDLIVLNEVEKYTSWGNEDQPARYKAMLEAKTGKKWYSHFTQEFGNWSSNGKGHQILSLYPFDATGHGHITKSDGLKGAGAISQATITVNGRMINVLLTHLDPHDQTMRLTQARDAIKFGLGFAENRLMTGDMNAWPDQTSIAEFNKTYNDSWTVAEKMGTATGVPGITPFGATKKGRIDYIFFSKQAPNLSVVSSKVYDTRDANGHMPSDHRPVVTTFLVK